LMVRFEHQPNSLERLVQKIRFESYPPGMFVDSEMKTLDTASGGDQ
jgi:hypothetical protein